jgi:hypothetical protein
MQNTDFYPFSIIFEGTQLPVPPEIKGMNIKWEETSLISHDMLPEFQCSNGEWVELQITEHGKIYKQISTQELVKDESDPVLGVKTENTSERLELQEDFTGVIRFTHYFPSEDGGSDYNIAWKSVFVHGDLDIVEVEEVKAMDPEVRLKAIEEIKESINDLNKNLKVKGSPAFRYLYQPYRFLLRGSFLMVSFVWRQPLLLLQWVVKKLTPY